MPFSRARNEMLTTGMGRRVKNTHPFTRQRGQVNGWGLRFTRATDGLIQRHNSRRAQYSHGSRRSRSTMTNEQPSPQSSPIASTRTHARTASFIAFAEGAALSD